MNIINRFLFRPVPTIQKTPLSGFPVSLKYLRVYVGLKQEGYSAKLCTPPPPIDPTAVRGIVVDLCWYLSAKIF